VSGRKRRKNRKNKKREGEKEREGGAREVTAGRNSLAEIEGKRLWQGVKGQICWLVSGAGRERGYRVLMG
jgi:hypothetical protein